VDFAGSPEQPANKAMLNEAVKHAVYEPFIGEWREISELIIAPELDLVFHGQKTAQAAAAVIAPKMNQMLAARKKAAH
jgi:hypothetical protein